MITIEFKIKEVENKQVSVDVRINSTDDLTALEQSAGVRILSAIDNALYFYEYETKTVEEYTLQ